MRRVIPAFGLAGFLLCGAHGQEAPLTFEVASVKPAAPQTGNLVFGTRGGPGSADPGRITFTNVTLKMVIVRAYDVQTDQISGPGWLDSEHYDIVATIPAGATKEQLSVMLQDLLAERFHLSFHREKKDFPVYELVAAKNGPKLKEPTGARNDSPRPVPTAGGRGIARDKNGFPLPPAGQTAQVQTNGIARMSGSQISAAQLAGFLRFPLGFIAGNNNPLLMSSQPRVIDKTGLTGKYDVTLEYAWPGAVTPSAAPDAGPLDNLADPAPTLFTALQQQLGLKLEQTKAPFDVLVIDRAEKVPTEN